jgi:GntR family transcriptional repressor for pyruvate dehydrogenase complex
MLAAMISDRRKTLSQAVAEDVLRRIEAGEFGVGERLPTLQELMGEHGVGYGVAREAMQQLVAVGVADVRPRRGAVVRQLEPDSVFGSDMVAALLSDKDVEDLYQLRALVEVAIASQAAANASDQQVEEIRVAQRRVEEAADAGRPVHEHDVVLHRAIAEASGNLVYVRVLDALADVLAALRKEAGAVPNATSDALREHAAIVDAIAAHDADAARAAMERHITTALEALRVARAA